MHTSRRNLIKGASAGLVTSAMVAATSRVACAQTSTPAHAPAPAGDKGIDIISLELLEQQAKKVMTPGAYAFIADASGDEWTLREKLQG